MQRLLISFLAVAAFGHVTLSADTDSEQSKYFVSNPKAIDYKFVGKKDEHRFGVELKENKQFHHTKTAEDGVRLGCYGHEQEGKKYSTLYVADGKGYRLVPDQGLITVYPKDGSEPRKASFVQSFTEDEIRSENIRYFFPDGCQSPKIEIGTVRSGSFFPSSEKKATGIPVRIKSENPITIPSRRTKVTTQPQKKAETTTLKTTTATIDSIETTTPANYFPPVVVSTLETTTPRKAKTITEAVGVNTQRLYIPPVTEAAKITTEAVEVTTQRLYTLHVADEIKSTPTTLKPRKIDTVPPFKKLENKCSDTCCDDNRPQILLSRASPDSCCKGVSKIVIPIESEVLSKIATNEIVDVINESGNVKMLQKLQKLIEKYEV